MKKTILFIFGIACFSFTIIAQNTIQLNPIMDNTLFESETGNLSNGAGQYIFAGQNNNNLLRRAVLKFDFSESIPDSATITEVSLTLTMNKTIAGATDIGVYKLNTDWGEGSSDASGQEGGGTSSQTNDATWIHSFYSSTFWTNPGGDYNSTSSAITAVTGNGSYDWSSADMISDVQNWLDTPESNFGWILIGDETMSPSTKRFASRENGSSGNWPVLSVTYTVPCDEPGIATVESSLSTFCKGDTVTLSVTGGNLNNATNWEWYENSCNGIHIGSGLSVLVSPVSNTSYYVRGEGSCVTPAECATIPIEVNQSYTDSISVDICEGESYIFGNDTLSTTGIYTQSLSTVNACDSTIILSLSVLDQFNVTMSASICEGESYTFGTQTLSESGTYTEGFTSVFGCDSIVELDLQVNSVYNESISATICEGESYEFGTQTLTTEGIYVEVFNSVQDCDSTVELILNVNSSYNQQITASICNGESYSFGSQTLTSSGSYTEIFNSIDGCDSIVELTLLVNETYEELIIESICEGESYVFGSQVLTSSGTYTEFFSTEFNCDSLVELILTVIDIDTSVNLSNNSITSNAADANYQWMDCNTNTAINSEINQIFTPLLSGTYAVIINLNFCIDTSSCIDFVITKIYENIFTSEIIFYPNPTDCEFIINLGKERKEVSIQIIEASGKQVFEESYFYTDLIFIELEKLHPGIYFVNVNSEEETAAFKILKK